MNTNNSNIVMVSSSIPTMLSFRGPLISYLLEIWNQVSIVWNANKVNHWNNFEWIVNHPSLHLYPITPDNFLSFEYAIYVKRLYTLLKTIKPDLILCFESPPVFSTLIINLCTRKNIATINFFPWFWKGKDFLSICKPFTKQLLNRNLIRWNVVMNAHDITYVTTKLELQNTFLMPAEYMHKVFETSFWEEKIIEKFQERVITFSFIWRLNFDKWFGDILDMLEMFSWEEIFKNTKFIFAWHIFGKDYEERLLRLINQYSNIVYLWTLTSEEVNEILIEDVHCSLLPTRKDWEWSPTILRESMATWVSFITTNTAGCNDLLYDNEKQRKTWFFCKPWSPESLLQSIKDFIDLYEENKKTIPEEISQEWILQLYNISVSDIEKNYLLRRIFASRVMRARDFTNESITDRRKKILWSTPLPTPWVDLWE